jgi:predicted lysophospholipase L1 biosynthesis ABC-type transport system permease subunit
VGVARDARYESVMGSIDPYFYVPFLQHYKDNSLESLEIRTPGDPASMVPEIGRVIHNTAPALPIFEVKTLQQALYSPNGLLLYQVAATLAGIMGSLGLILAVIGVYGVLAYIVSQKTNEIGIRMALGAQRLDVLKTIYRHGLWIVGIGLTLGVVASVFVARLLHSMIVVSPTDPTTYVGVSATLIVVALSACYIPARRAMHIEPMQALRAE